MRVLIKRFITKNVFAFFHVCLFILISAALPQDCSEKRSNHHLHFILLFDRDDTLSVEIKIKKNKKIIFDFSIFCMRFSNKIVNLVFIFII